MHLSNSEASYIFYGKPFALGKFQKDGMFVGNDPELENYNRLLGRHEITCNSLPNIFGADDFVGSRLTPADIFRTFREVIVAGQYQQATPCLIESYAKGYMKYILDAPPPRCTRTLLHSNLTPYRSCNKLLETENIKTIA
eukprot:SAG31_NODE_629_length_13436_cov_116.287825_7_plen_140_part_00